MTRRPPACLAAALGAGALVACQHEPVKPPEAPAPAQYTSTPVAAEGLAPGKDIPADWWTLFQSPPLDALVRRALDESPTLVRAQARLRQAQEDLNARTGATEYPRVDAKLSANRLELGSQSFGAQPPPVKTPLNLYLATVSVSYTFDLFGANRRELEALRAEVDHQQFELEGARLMLAGNIVTTGIREAALREQIAATQELIDLQEQSLAIAQRMEKAGGLARADVVAQHRELAQARAALPDLQRDLERLRHRLAVYAGQAPGAPGLPEFRLLDLKLPPELPLSLPSALARQRPDIRAAESLLVQAGARVGVATANLYPQITLSATLGSLTTTGGDLFSSGTGFALLGGSLVQPLFRGGELEAKRRSALAAYDQAGAAYRETVLQGFREVADALRALEADGGRLRERADALAQARRYRDITVERYKAGGVSQAAVLDALRQYRRARLEQAQALADRYADSAALLQALGGGWWSREPLPKGESQ
jgi:NodT family efflux transporter outer membrane factor (OMF) lipoprotein